MPISDNAAGFSVLDIGLDSLLHSTTTDRLACHLRFGGALRPAQCLKFYALFHFGSLVVSKAFTSNCTDSNSATGDCYLHHCHSMSGLYLGGGWEATKLH